MIDKGRFEQSLKQDMTTAMETANESNQEGVILKVMIAGVLTETFLDSKEDDFEDYEPEEKEILRSISEEEFKAAAEEWASSYIEATQISLLYAAKHPIKFENAMVDLYFNNLQELIEEKRNEMDIEGQRNEIE